MPSATYLSDVSTGRWRCSRSARFRDQESAAEALQLSFDTGTTPDQGTSPGPLLFDDTAGDAVAGVAGGVRHEIVGLRVDDQGRSAIVEERIGSVFKGDAVSQKCSFAIALLVHRQIHEVAKMWMRICGVVDAVMGVSRVEVAASGGEGRGIAF